MVTRTMPPPILDVDDYCKISGLVYWSEGAFLLAKGTRYTGPPELMKERPDLFGPYPYDDGTPNMELPKCWTCGEGYEPPPNNGAVSRYCGRKCRRARERILARAVRITRRHSVSNIPSNPGLAELTEFIAEIDSQRGAVAMLIENLGGKLHQGPAPAPDEIQLNNGDPTMLLRAARNRYLELNQLWNDARAEGSAAAERDSEMWRARERQRRQTEQYQADQAAHGSWDRLADALHGSDE